MKKFLDVTSFSGVNFEYAKYFSRANYSVGLSFGWNIFSDHINGTTYFSTNSGGRILTGAITGDQVKYNNVFPLLVTGTYYFKPHENDIIPYISIGTGTYYVSQRYLIGVWEVNSDLWHFGIATEAGVMFRLKEKLGLNTSAKLNYAFDSGESVVGNETNDFSYWTINVGLTWVL
jgi:outer membrane protein W